MPVPPEDRGFPRANEEKAQELSPSPDKGNDTIKLVAEELSVGRERVETGRVRVRTVTREDQEYVDVPLQMERVEVERVPIGREIDEIPPRRQEGDTIIVPVVEEVVTVLRKMVLKEELHIKVVRTTEQYREAVTVRRQEAIIERIPAESPPEGTDPAR